MKSILLTVLFLLSIIANVSGSYASAFTFPLIASTGQLISTRFNNKSAGLPNLYDFITSMQNGESQTLVGVYVGGVMALPVIQQPAAQPAYVSSDNNVLTQFSMASQYGTTGILAHNYLAGDNFFKIVKGQDVVLVFGDGKTKTYRIEDIQSYQALSPYSVYSNFVDLSAPTSKLSSTEVFNRVYGQAGALVLQTCIKVGSESSWGRIFLIGREKSDTAQVSIQAQRAMRMAALYQAAYANY
jgi:hypothetical protein